MPPFAATAATLRDSFMEATMSSHNLMRFTLRQLAMLVPAAVLALSLTGTARTAVADEPALTPKIGSPAPEFKLQDQSGRWHSLADYRGKWVALYFYPKDDTPGCTTEACSFRDNVFAFR